MFNKSFYPTPIEVLMQMDLHCTSKVCYEPHAGKGDIIDYLVDNGAKTVLASELNDDLAAIAKTKCHQFIGPDFFKVTASQISHVELIVMNPPFSNGDKHLLHAWQIAPPGCQIHCLLNAQTIENDYTQRRKELVAVIDDYGTYTIFEKAFKFAERKTGVDVAYVKLFKPGSANADEWQGFFMQEEHEEQANGIMRFDAIRDVVNRYVGAVKCFDEHMALADKMNSLTKGFDVGGFSFQMEYDNQVTDRETFKKQLQKKAWQMLFKKMNLEKYVTSGVIEKVNQFAEKQHNVPFTMRNVYHMFEIIAGTFDQNINESLVETVDRFTRHTHENRYAIEGWKTNAGHLLNKKIIIPYIVGISYGGKMKIARSVYADQLKDLVKAMCAITGTNYNHIIEFDDLLQYRYKLYHPNYACLIKKVVFLVLGIGLSF